MMIRATLLSVFLSACAAHGESYTLYISPGFTDEYAQHIEEAARDWERMVPTSFVVHRAACPGLERTTTCVFPVEASYFQAIDGHTPVGNTWCDGTQDDACRILLDTDFLDDGRRQLAGHELGHAMGLQHEGPGTSHPTTGPVIMAPSMDLASLRPTCLDAAAWYAIRGWVVPACPEIPDRIDDLD